MVRLNDIISNKKLMIHIIKYLIFGVLTTIVSLGSFWLLRAYLSFINENVSNIISIVVGIIFAYITSRIFVFESKDKNIFREFFIFASSRTFTFVFDVVCFYIFATCLGFDEMLVKIAISVFVVLLNYILSKIFVFKDRKDIKNG